MPQIRPVFCGRGFDDGGAGVVHCNAPLEASKSN